jgi:pyruvate formate-lyase activating enzyme-like uncharacterized protein
MCKRSCFYCPISSERRGRDLVFADEKPVDEIADILEEAVSIGALGTGITGGEPLLKPDYVIECIKAIKAKFGADHYIHLYTGILPDSDMLSRLKEAGLDEIRFHPPQSEWSNADGLYQVLCRAKSVGLLAGVEIPAVSHAPAIVKAVADADAFLNLNELEFSETNYARLSEEGFMPVELGCGAEGSESIAKEYFRDDGLKVHYCPSRFKDAVQLKERLLRRAERTSRPFDYVSEEGTVIHGTIEGDVEAAQQILRDLEVPLEMYSCLQDRIDIAAPILEDIAFELKGFNCILSIVERYPIDNGPILERIPL